MSRAAGLCGKCGGPRRGRSARTAAPIGQCEVCRVDICLKHARWQGDYYLCYKCARQGKKSDIRIELPEDPGTADDRPDIEPRSDSPGTGAKVAGNLYVTANFYDNLHEQTTTPEGVT